MLHQPPRVGIVTFHDTPNFGATLQCYALSEFLKSEGACVEVVNYRPRHARIQYLKSLFLGRRRSLANIGRIQRFRRFVGERLRLSGPATADRHKLRRLAHRYDLAITGSDEVWKVDHMRRLDPTFYLDAFDRTRTRLISYAASASTVTDLRHHAPIVEPLLRRLHAISVREPHTALQVQSLTGVDPLQVVDPTFLWNWHSEEQGRIEQRRYIAVYSWLSASEFRHVRAVAMANDWAVVCVGCRHPDADANYVAIGPAEWLRLFRHAELVVTNFFHGVVFALLFGRPLYAHVDPAKRIKLERVLQLAGEPALLHDGLEPLSGGGMAVCRYDAEMVQDRLHPLVEASKAFLRMQLEAARGDVAVAT